jgi:hypothetical protein
LLFTRRVSQAFSPELELELEPEEVIWKVCSILAAGLAVRDGDTDGVECSERPRATPLPLALRVVMDPMRVLVLLLALLLPLILWALLGELPEDALERSMCDESAS